MLFSFCVGFVTAIFPVFDKRGCDCLDTECALILCGWVSTLLCTTDWCISKRTRNRILHTLHGNGKNGSGKGRGRASTANIKGKGGNTQHQGFSSSSNSMNPFANMQSDHLHMQDMISTVRRHEEQQVDKQYKERIRESLPQAAWVKHATVLIDEWTAQVCHPSELTASGGISYVTKDLLPGVLKRVGFTQTPTAVVTSQPARELGLPYPSVQVRCSLNVATPEGTREVVEVTKYLTQLGYGDQVEQRTAGPCLTLPKTMHKCVVRFDTLSGITAGELTGRIVAETVSKHIHPAMFIDVVVRQDGTATLMVQDASIPDLLRASGKDHVYFRIHSSDPESDKIEMLWLPEHSSHEDALAMVEPAKSLGLALKKTTGGTRYGLRFNSVDELDAWAIKKQLGEKHKLGRFRASNIPSTVGLRGVYDMFSPFGWDIQEIEFFGESGVVFLASQRGTHDQLHYIDHHQRRVPVLVKALNSRARAMTKTQSTAASASAKAAATPAQQERSDVQKTLFKKRTEKPAHGQSPPSKQAKGQNEENS